MQSPSVFLRAPPCFFRRKEPALRIRPLCFQCCITKSKNKKDQWGCGNSETFCLSSIVYLLTSNFYLLSSPLYPLSPIPYPLSSIIYHLSSTLYRLSKKIPQSFLWRIFSYISDYTNLLKSPQASKKERVSRSWEMRLFLTSSSFTMTMTLSR